jgi:hypothetical protein
VENLHRDLHESVALPFIKTSRWAMELRALSEQDAMFRKDLVLGVMTPRVLAKRKVAPGGTTRGLHQITPQTLNKQLEGEHNFSGNIVIEGADPAELVAEREGRSKAQRALGHKIIELEATRYKHAQAEEVNRVMQAALAESLPSHMCESARERGAKFILDLARAGAQFTGARP